MLRSLPGLSGIYISSIMGKNPSVLAQKGGLPEKVD